MDETTIAINPARAGMIRTCAPRRRRSECKPRASGDDPHGDEVFTSAEE